ncbi:hypothetical protein CGI05_23260 [Vibrio parahaemolyticus]|nr:hypothetical protein CGI05_23260 [Vibrio parahaemolyticus]
MSSLLVARHRATILSRTKLCKQQTLCALTHLNQAHSQSDYSMKPLGTNNAVENGLTTPKNAFGKPISQCELSTKSLKPRGTYNTRENVISASKSTFVPTSSPSGVATKNRLSIVLLCQNQRTKQPLEHFQNLGLKIAKTEFW